MKDSWGKFYDKLFNMKTKKLLWCSFYQRDSIEMRDDVKKHLISLKLPDGIKKKSFKFPQFFQNFLSIFHLLAFAFDKFFFFTNLNEIYFYTFPKFSRKKKFKNPKNSKKALILSQKFLSFEILFSHLLHFLSPLIVSCSNLALAHQIPFWANSTCYL